MTMNLTVPILLMNSNDIGISINITANGMVNSLLRTGMRCLEPAVYGGAPASKVFNRDANSNGYIDTVDARTLSGWTYNNIGVRITADAVPELATVGTVANGLVVLLARRRKKQGSTKVDLSGGESRLPALLLYGGHLVAQPDVSS